MSNTPAADKDNGFPQMAKLLGGWFEVTGSMDDDTEMRLAAARAAWARLQRCFQYSGLTCKQKGGLVKAVIVSTLLYGCEARSFTKAQYDRYQVFMNRVVRGVCLSKGDGIREMKGRSNMADLRAKCGVELVETMIKRRQLLYIGHVARMPADRWERRVLHGVLLPEAERPGLANQGRNRRSLLLHYQMLINEITDIDSRPWQVVACEGHGGGNPTWQRVVGTWYKREVNVDRQSSYAGGGGVRQATEEEIALPSVLPGTGGQCPRCGGQYVRLNRHLASCRGAMAKSKAMASAVLPKAESGRRLRQCQHCQSWVANLPLHVPLCRQNPQRDEAANKRACPTCGRMISTKPGSWARHERACANGGGQRVRVAGGSAAAKRHGKAAARATAEDVVAKAKATALTPYPKYGIVPAAVAKAPAAAIPPPAAPAVVLRRPAAAIASAAPPVPLLLPAAPAAPPAPHIIPVPPKAAVAREVLRRPAATAVLRRPAAAKRS
eukprot:TRINITY_DN10479_c0_g1_i1.p1 TRINITY_DN10479_c0_g1~~TRINITY_DN10479_c0_g1_i1.p1  ORF type:complete len:570 (-),score=56.05 TRINITY_DN10479_c0_g1_i1:71-1555(-)